MRLIDRGLAKGQSLKQIAIYLYKNYLATDTLYQRQIKVNSELNKVNRELEKKQVTFWDKAGWGSGGFVVGVLTVLTIIFATK